MVRSLQCGGWGVECRVWGAGCGILGVGHWAWGMECGALYLSQRDQPFQFQGELDYSQSYFFHPYFLSSPALKCVYLIEKQTLKQNIWLTWPWYFLHFYFVNFIFSSTWSCNRNKTRWLLPICWHEILKHVQGFRQYMLTMTLQIGSLWKQLVWLVHYHTDSCHP